MGADIHAFIEYRRNIGYSWTAFSGEISLNRHYGLFAVLGDVRNSDEFPTVAANRGVPIDCSHEVLEEYTCFIIDEDTEDEKYISKKDALKYIANKQAVYFGDGNQQRIILSDNHSGSWCNAGELKKVFEFPKMNMDRCEDWQACLMLLQYFESQGLETRMVFWFDN